MQRENVVSISFFEDSVRFADLINGYIYHGREMISPQDIREINCSIARIAKTVKKDKFNGVIDTQVVTADVMCEVGQDMRVALIALENQSDIHYAMPVRVMNAESIQYHKQWRVTAKHHRKVKDLKGAEFLSGFSKEDKLVPMITIVIYFGKEPWDGPTSLKQMMDLASYPPEFGEMVEDFRIHLLEVRKYERLEEFCTDIQYVFGFLQHEKSKGELATYINEHSEIFENLNEDAYDMISAITHSEELFNLKSAEKMEGGFDMCQAIKEMIEDGRLEGKLEVYQSLVNEGVLGIEEVAKRMSMSVEELQEKIFPA
ncbi:MAG: transposase [Lachnospiraceae bacterium]|nr:transposase [Lachnospiraceae bacterium]